MIALYIIAPMVALAAWWSWRRVAEETVGVMAISIASVLLLCALAFAPWQFQLVGVLALVCDRFELLSAKN
ncbi:hypothetical protein JJD41_16370 [Oxynema sp. CENA135]|uniref:hypothetical protein n=1 Tax=Oxynema sp. CENA135 TaxID=984206 RepID=UPI00190AAC3D|nr:hypothetical protein [Oxynema sp. CENA135]MBK4731426.1 hypothetical protein [Oxynema sp. CENA135]